MVCYSDETLYAPSHSLSSLHFRSFSRGFMSESPIHIAWLVTHILRSLFERHQGSTLVEGLTIEVQTLQAELHRSQRVLAGYGELLQRCEANGGRPGVIQFFAAFWWFLLRYQCTRGGYTDHGFRWSNLHPLVTVLVGQAIQKTTPPLQFLDLNLTTLGGPLRPSQLGKGRKRA